MESFNSLRTLSLIQQSQNDHLYLFPETNPVVHHLGSYSEDSLRSVLENYSQFSMASVHFLLDAALRLPDWPQFVEALAANIAEERGSKTGWVPHLRTMQAGYLELGIKCDEVVPNRSTEVFLEKMSHCFRGKSQGFIAGAALALEAAAYPEFQVLRRIVDAFAVKIGKVLRSEAPINVYINGHLDFEVGHANELFQAAADGMHRENAAQVQAGYRAVCQALSVWWERLAHLDP